jgi:O-antigen/teichoic acid export membrane protein
MSKDKEITVQRIAKNTGLLVISQVISYLLGFIYIMYTARHLKKEGFGVLSFALAFTQIFGVLIDLGLGPLIVREVARDKSLASKYLANIGVMKLVLAVITFILVGLVINLLGYPLQTVRVVYLIALSVIFIALTRMLYSIFQAFEKMVYQSLGQILNGVLMLTGIIYAIGSDFSVVGFALIYSAASFIVFGYSLVILRWKFAGPIFSSSANLLEIDRSFWKQSLIEAWPMAAAAVWLILYFRIDTVMLSLMKGDAAVGLYGAAYRVSEVSTIVPAMFVASVFPVMSRYHKDSRDLFVNAYGKAVKFMLYIALPMAMTVTLLARPIVNLIFKEEYLASTVALQILIWSAAFSYVGIVLGTVLLTADKQMLRLKLLAVVLVLSVVLNLIMIPKYSYKGASIATVITRVAGLVLNILFLNRCGYKLALGRICRAPLVGLSAAGALVVLLTYFDVNVFIVASICLVVYSLIIYLTGINEDDKWILKVILRR